MPATPDLVTLDHAKKWAKRLLKNTPTFRQLAQAQMAVAVMLGHASWHALTQNYKAAPASCGPAPSEALSVQAQADAIVQDTLDRLNRHYPGLDALEVQVMAHDLTLLATDEYDLSERMRQLCYDGEDVHSAAHEALTKATMDVVAPPGHMLVQVRTAHHEAVLTLLPARQ